MRCDFLSNKLNISISNLKFLLMSDKWNNHAGKTICELSIVLKIQILIFIWLEFCIFGTLKLQL
jgi:hypothetical protein